MVRHSDSRTQWQGESSKFVNVEATEEAYNNGLYRGHWIGYWVGVANAVAMIALGAALYWLLG